MDEISVRFAKISALLENKDFWERRVEGLKLLQRAFLEDVSTLGYEAAIGLLNQIKIPLKTQLEDKRSQIARDACACVTELARSTISDQSVWEHVSDWFIPSLLNNSCNTIAIVAHAALECLRTIATIGILSRQAILIIINSCGHKHTVVRRNSLECLLIVLHTVDVTVLQKLMLSAHKAVRTCLSDPLQEARKLARMCFWGLEKVHEDSAVVLYEGLAPNVQRSIDGEKGSYEAWAANFGATARQVQSALKSKSSQSEATNMTSKPDATARRPSSKGELPSNSTSHHHHHQPHLATGDRSTGYSHMDTQARQGPAAISFLTGQPMASHIDTRTQNTEDYQKDRRSATPTGRGPTRRQSVVFATTRSSSNKAVKSPATNVLDPVRPKSPAPSTNKQNNLLKSVGKSPITTTPSNYSTDVASGIVSSTPSLTKPQSTLLPTNSPRDTWEAIKTAATSSDWSSRSMAFVELSQLVDLNLLPPEHLSEAVEVSATKLSDSHYRVAVSATGAMARLITKSPKDAFEHIETILAAQIENLSSQKETLRSAATVQLGAILNAFGATNLQTPLWKVILAATTGKVRLGAIEYLLHVIQSNKVTFANPTAMKPLFNKLFGFWKKLSAIEPSASDVQRAIAAIFAMLYSANPEVFINITIHLSAEDYKLFVKVCSSVIPHLHQDCQRVKEGQKALRHPEPNVHSPFERRLQLCSPSPARKEVGGFGEFALAAERALTPLFAEGGQPTGAANDGVKSKPSLLASPPRGQGSLVGNGAQSASQFSPNRFSATHISHTDVGAALLDSTNAIKHNTPAHVLPKRAAQALAKLEAVPPPLQLLFDASNSPHSSDRMTAMEGAMEALRDQPRLWSHKFREFLAYFIAFAADPDTNVRLRSLKALEAIFTTRYLVPLCVGHIDDAFRCAVVNLNDHRPEAQQSGNSLIKAIHKGAAPASTASAPASVGRFPSPSLSSHFDPSTVSFGGGGKYDFLSSYFSSGAFPSTSSHSSLNEPLYPLECLADSAMAVLEEGIGSLHQRGQMALLKLGAELTASIIGSSEAVGLQASFALPTPRLEATATFGQYAKGTSHTAATKEAILHRFMPIIEHAINSTHSEVRKQAVMAIVDWYAAAGSALLPHLKHLTSAQLKLASIFYNRQQGAARDGMMIGSVDLLTEMEKLGVRLHSL